MTYAILYIAAMAILLVTLAGCQSSRHLPHWPDYSQCMTGPATTCFEPWERYHRICNQHWLTLDQQLAGEGLVISPIWCVELDTDGDSDVDLMDFARKVSE